MGAPADYCREVEAYLCRKNDGHLIRIVGPAFAVVSGWAEQGVPLNVACAGIDRYFERYYRKGPRRRPVRVEFCEADVRDAFDDWRRAVGVALPPGTRTSHPPLEGEDDESTVRHGRQPSLASHIERVIARLTALRAGGAAPAALGEMLERTVRALDPLVADARRARGDGRTALLDELSSLDRTLATAAADALDDAARLATEREASDALAPFRDRMPPEAFQRALTAAFARSVRDRYGLPTVSYDRG